MAGERHVARWNERSDVKPDALARPAMGYGQMSWAWSGTLVVPMHTSTSFIMSAPDNRLQSTADGAILSRCG